MVDDTGRENSSAILECKRRELWDVIFDRKQNDNRVEEGMVC